MAYHSTIRERVLYSLVSLKEDEIIWLVRKIHTTRILERIMGILVTDIYSIGLLIGRNVCNWIILSREKCFWVWLVCGRMVSVSQPSQACEASLLTIRQFINCAFLEISVLPSVDSLRSYTPRRRVNTLQDRQSRQSLESRRSTQDLPR